MSDYVEFQWWLEVLGDLAVQTGGYFIVATQGEDNERIEDAPQSEKSSEASTPDRELRSPGGKSSD